MTSDEGKKGSARAEDVLDPFTVIDCTQLVVMTLSQATQPLPPIKMALLYGSGTS
jgi:hypothetical protein